MRKGVDQPQRSAHTCFATFCTISHRVPDLRAALSPAAPGYSAVVALIPTTAAFSSLLSDNGAATAMRHTKTIHNNFAHCLCLPRRVAVAGQASGAAVFFERPGRFFSADISGTEAEQGT